MTLHVRDLSYEELEELWQKLDEGALPVKRVLVVALSGEKYTVQKIAQEADLHPINVRKWIHRFNAEGIEGLISGKSPGRPLVFSAEQREQIVALKTQNPKWTLARIQRHLIQKRVVDSISIETVRKIVRSRES